MFRTLVYPRPMANVSLWLYRLLVAALLPVAGLALKLRQVFSGKSRPRFRDRLGRNLPEMPGGGIWIQAVSVGEVELARRLVAELRERAPELPLVLSATTATGLDLARRTLGQSLSVFPCPIDLPGPVDRVFEAVRPKLLVLVETELWPEMLHQAGRRGSPVAVVNARLSEASFAGYRRVAGPLRSLLDPLALVLARTAADGERFVGLGVPPDRVSIGGNVKYDLEADHRPLEWQEDIRNLAGINIYHEYDVLASIAGGLPSTLPPEEDWLSPETGPDLEKYIQRKPGVSSDKLHRLFRFISDYSCSAMNGWALYAGVHGGGSPVMEKIGIRSEYDLESKKQIAKYLAGIKDE